MEALDGTPLFHACPQSKTALASDFETGALLSGPGKSQRPPSWRCKRFLTFLNLVAIVDWPGFAIEIHHFGMTTK
ncbi:MAG: hypothetical protein BZY87_01645 [SAR202 cluster bacterium Io17-Chloro-G6]|nr:MAG: hypothetical protein BZY87_01645 [SAR202 cluster bacterium Io17-Chloro-G6]